jgi:hypothetical protein
MSEEEHTGITPQTCEMAVNDRKKVVKNTGVRWGHYIAKGSAETHF